jgi:hypothetical protein
MLSSSITFDPVGKAQCDALGRDASWSVAGIVPIVDPAIAVTINLGLVFPFDFFHSLMASQSFKR